MNRKIVFLLLLALPLCLALAACGDKPEPSPTPEPTFMMDIGQQFQNNVKPDPDDKYDVIYSRCRVAVEAVSEEELAILAENESHIRDIINTIMSSKTLKELERSDAKERLKTEISEHIVVALADKGITDLAGVYFSDYLTIKQ